MFKAKLAKKGKTFNYKSKWLEYNLTMKYLYGMYILIISVSFIYFLNNFLVDQIKSFEAKTSDRKEDLSLN